MTGLEYLLIWSVVSLVFYFGLTIGTSGPIGEASDFLLVRDELEEKYWPGAKKAQEDIEGSHRQKPNFKAAREVWRKK